MRTYELDVTNKHGLRLQRNVECETDAEAWRVAWKTFAAEDITIYELDSNLKRIRLV